LKGKSRVGRHPIKGIFLRLAVNTRGVITEADCVRGNSTLQGEVSGSRAEIVREFENLSFSSRSLAPEVGLAPFSVGKYLILLGFQAQFF
jgi:hypothetical protein